MEKKFVQILYAAGIREEPKSPYFKFRELTKRKKSHFVLICTQEHREHRSRDHPGTHKATPVCDLLCSHVSVVIFTSPVNN